MAHQTFALNLARSMIADQGVAIIWRLHVEATVLWRMGNRAAAEAFVEIADAAEPNGSVAGRLRRAPPTSPNLQHAIRKYVWRVVANCNSGRADVTPPAPAALRFNLLPGLDETG